MMRGETFRLRQAAVARIIVVLRSGEDPRTTAAGVSLEVAGSATAVENGLEGPRAAAPVVPASLRLRVEQAVVPDQEVYKIQ